MSTAATFPTWEQAKVVLATLRDEGMAATAAYFSAAGQGGYAIIGWPEPGSPGRFLQPSGAQIYVAEKSA